MPRKKNTAVWENYFNSATSKTVKCKHCGKVYQFGNVSKMTSHLLKCYRCPTVIKNKLQKIPVTSTTATNLPLQVESQHEKSQDNSLTDTTSIKTSPEISPEKKLYLDQLLAKAIFVTGSPISIVEHPLWVRFFDELQPLYKLPSRKAISTTHLETIYNEMVDEHKRNRLTTDRAAKIDFISYNWNLLRKYNGDNDDYEPLSTSKQLSSPLGSPIKEERPSTSRENRKEIAFCNINDHDSSDSD